MKKIFLIFLLIFTNLSAEDFRLEKIIKGLKVLGACHLLIIIIY